jgi:hypothetical protein
LCPYIGRISGWDISHPLLIRLRSVGLTCLQYPTRVQPFKVGRVAGAPDVMGEALIRLRWSDFPLQSEPGRRIEFKASCFNFRPVSPLYGNGAGRLAYGKRQTDC